ncbi:hypothetical protein GOODEAATRI_006199 [Goodea atripinnis]|uniref:Uncharacterized protein n=1 Tax=Goodea atripinnis TaxID=208336 RepID=A0ABV0MPQ0_9TELE
MTADINVILQTLQRQIAPVPPAYSIVSPSTLPIDPSALYGTGATVLHSVYPSWDHMDLKSSRKSQESLSSGIHMTAASDDTMSMTVTPETETHADLTPKLPQQLPKSALEPISRLCETVRYPSLPVNLDLTTGPAEIQKHTSDPVLPVT